MRSFGKRKRKGLRAARAGAVASRVSAGEVKEFPTQRDALGRPVSLGRSALAPRSFFQKGYHLLEFPPIEQLELGQRHNLDPQVGEIGAARGVLENAAAARMTLVAPVFESEPDIGPVQIAVIAAFRDGLPHTGRHVDQAVHDGKRNAVPAKPGRQAHEGDHDRLHRRGRSVHDEVERLPGALDPGRPFQAINVLSELGNAGQRFCTDMAALVFRASIGPAQLAAHFDQPRKGHDRGQLREAGLRRARADPLAHVDETTACVVSRRHMAHRTGASGPAIRRRDHHMKGHRKPRRAFARKGSHLVRRRSARLETIGRTQRPIPHETKALQAGYVAQIKGHTGKDSTVHEFVKASFYVFDLVFCLDEYPLDPC